MSTALIPTNYYQGFLASEHVSQNLKIYLALTKSFLFFYASLYSQIVFAGERKSWFNRSDIVDIPAETRNPTITLLWSFSMKDENYNYL